ncbi:hypothetical protein [Mesorhizobium sp. M2A.F.Ca.ET.039.01.1.1]|uniref:hypothetical protein n=1 Tax=Mesorhizobium sp. M2A.F.Ca.ET.039.01.1.1 TaxID=2496746 RepID=UPI000FCC2C66|nr:hypothetical protein [Mesorhizobium sp. M2A.F.Ca.ET.039.01.1.1]RWX61215.1 hypothetical protein EOA24_30910 [Mesorhizobium sp. M2A.F.Ca.ET.039.01.1.1]
MKESISLMDSFIVVHPGKGANFDEFGPRPAHSDRKPAAPVGIALDVSETKWNKYFTKQAFWFFRSGAPVRTEEEAF